MCVVWSQMFWGHDIELPATQEILHRPHPDPSKKLSFNVSYFEIYKDEVYDLLGDRETVGCWSGSRGWWLTSWGSRFQAPKLPVRENDAGQIFVANLSSLPVSTEQEFQSIYSWVVLIPALMLAHQSKKQ